MRLVRFVRLGAATVFVGTLLNALPAVAQDNLGGEVTQLEARVGRLDGLLTAQTGTPVNQGPPYTERFADAELLYQLRDYARASVLFTDLVTNYRDTPAYSNALFLLGESLYQAGDRLGARARFREVIAHSRDPVFRPFLQRSLGRLIEIALKTGDVSGVEEVFAEINQIPPAEIEAQTTYVRGKYYFLRAQPNYDLARQAFDSVPERSPMYAQARYFLGAILTAQERLPEAIEAFQRVRQLQVDPGDVDKQQVLDLAALAVGRLQMERNNYDEAIDAYQSVGRSSPFFDRALFEQAWAFVRSGDAIRAERALEILAIANPDSPLIPEGKLMWGNLLLRTGRFQRAQQVFEEVRSQFGPISQQLEQMVAQNTDPELYFRQLIISNIQAFDAANFIPPAALAYVRNQGNLDEALSVVSDLNTCRQYIRESEDLIGRLNSALNSPSRAHVFGDLRTAREEVFQIINRTTQLRAIVAAGLDRAGGGAGDVNLQGVILQRQGLEESVRRLPTTPDAIRRRDNAAEGEFSTLAQELQRAFQQVNELESLIVAIEQYVQRPTEQRGGIDIVALRTELQQHRTAVTAYRERISELRRLITAGRSQIGVGDPRYQRDLEIAQEYRELVDREASSLQQSGRMPTELQNVLARLEVIDRRARDFDATALGVVDRRVGTLRTQVQEEETRVGGYKQRLAQLEGEASDVVGRLVMQSFASVRLHFYRIVMRADLGLVDVAWEEREEHNNRARILAEEQNREIDALNDEFREVIEGSEPDPNANQQGTGANTPANPGGGGTNNSTGQNSPSNGPAQGT